MAKSKSGGSRAYLRGRIGSDVYSIGKNGKGEKQQVVRSLAEQVANPQTLAQMKGRMYMSTVMQAVSTMSQLIDHSFDNVPNGQPCISEFIRTNYALIKADAAAHPTTDNLFGLNKYHEKGMKNGRYVVSKGEGAGLGSACSVENGSCSIAIVTSGKTLADLVAALGITVNDYFTWLGTSDDDEFGYFRVKINSDADLTAVLTKANIEANFTFESEKSVTVAVTESAVSFYIFADANYSTAIVSRKTANGFIHNNATLMGEYHDSWTSDVALPTYPVGKAKFLNGGDL